LPFCGESRRWRGHLAVREPTSNPKYVAVSDYVWDPQTRIMALAQLTLDECTGEGAARCG
jgi:hypothetical protein